MAVSREQVAKLYVATFNRAPDEAGLDYWIDNSGLTIEQIARSFFDQAETQATYPAGTSNTTFVTTIYQNLFNRAPDAAGLAYWVAELDAGKLSKDVMILAVINGALGSDATILSNKTQVGLFYADELHLEGTEFKLTSVTADAATMVNAMKAASALANSTQIDAPNTPDYDQILTLKKVVNETVTVTTDNVTTTYWGDGENKLTLDQFYTMVNEVTGLDLFLLGNIDIDATAALTDVSLVTGPDNDADADGNTLMEMMYTTATGEQFTSELALGQEYVALLDSLIYFTDADGNKVSRFSNETVEVTNQTSAFSYAPIILTPTVNNGGTYETGYTTAGDDLIVAGQTELLHGAYINGGAGYNTLEVDMKGVYAQPVQLINIQEVHVQNLPNVYGDFYDLNDDANADGTNIPDYLDIATATANAAIASDAADAAAAGAAAAQDAFDAAVAAFDNATIDTTEVFRELMEIAQNNLIAANQAAAAANAELAYANAIVSQAENPINADSILDLSRAIDLETLVVTEGRNTGAAVGDLTIVGVRGNATTVLEGMFSAQTVAIFYSEGLADGVNLTLNLGDVDGTKFTIFHNSNTININSIGGGNVMEQANFGDATLMNMNISGTAKFVVTDSISDNFTSGHPATIDASENTAGVDITMDDFNDEVVFVGTAVSDDHFNASNNGKWVSITGGHGNNEFVADDGEIVTITSGSGNNEISAQNANISATITVGDGMNQINADSSAVVAITAGNGQNTITAQSADEATIVAGNGGNTIDVSYTDVSTITTGNGNDTIVAMSDNVSVTVNAGNGNNDIQVCAQNIDVTSGTGNDTITLSYSAGRTTVNVDAGAGVNTVMLADASTDDGFNNGIIAEAGSVIKATGGSINLVVNSDSELQFATLENIASVVLSNDNTYADVNPVTLTLTAEQFIAIGADNFSVLHSGFGDVAELNIIVSESMNFDELGIDNSTFNCDVIDLNIVLACNNPTEVVFTLTAEQLHTYIAPDGISVDSLNNYDNNQVVVTDASLSFDAFGDQNNGIGGGTIDDTIGRADVTVIRTLDGWSRPVETGYSDTLTIDSDVTPAVGAIGDTDTLVDTLIIEGSADMTISGPVNLGDNFTVDFSALTGTMNTFTITQFEQITTPTTVPNSTDDVANWGQIIGNGTAAEPVRINIELTDESTVGFDNITKGGFKSSGVQTYVVTELLDDNGDAISQAAGGTATVYVCDQTQDLETLGLQNNRNAEVTFENVNWGTTILLEGDGYANASEQEKNLGNPDLSEIGSVVVNFFEAGANAVVNINNQGVELGMNEDAQDGIDAAGERVLDVRSIVITNADRLDINVADGDAVINEVVATDVENIRVTGTEDVTMDFADDNFGTLATINASGVAGTFTLDITGNANLSEVALSGIDALVLQGESVTLTLNADQVVELGAAIVDSGLGTQLDVTGLSTQVLDLSAIDVDNIGTVTTAEGYIVLAEGTNLGGADELIITANTMDTTLQMTADQFHTYCGDTDGDEATIITCTSVSNDATLKLTDVAADESIDLTNVDTAGHTVGTPADGDVTVVVEIAGLTATEDFEIINGPASLEVSGANDLTEASIATINQVVFTGDATLTLTADQIVAIEAAYDALITGDDNATNSAFSVLNGANVTINVIDLGTQALDLNDIMNAGITIGTVSIVNEDAPITLNAATTFGGATTIITPTADTTSPEYGVESTTVTMSIAQLETSAGVITGDSQINLTGLVGNTDTDGNYTLDTTTIDLSGIANAGTLSLGEDVITLAETTDLGNFTIILADGQLIRFATEDQAAADISVASGITTGVQWLFTTSTGSVDTTGYDADITTLFIDEAILLSQPVEEDLWTELAGTIVVEKINGDTIPSLVKYNRTNTFEALANIPAGINYDDSAEFSTVSNLTMNLEGEVNIGNVTVGDTANGDGTTPNIDGQGYFQSLTINSYLDTSTIDGYDPTAINGIALEKNYIGNISLNAGALDELVDITINTYADVDNIIGDPDGAGPLLADDANGFYDAENVNGGAAERDGMAISVGTITFGANEAKFATLTITGDNNVEIAGVDIADAEVNFLTIDAETHTGEMHVGNIMNDADLGAYGTVYVMDGFTAVAATDLNTASASELLAITGGDNDLTLVSTPGNFGITDVAFSADSTLTLTAAQIAQIGTADAVLVDGIADHWSALTGLNVTLDIVDLSTEALSLDLVAAAGINIGTITIKDTNADVTLDPATNLGGADSIIVPEGTTLNLTAAQFEQLAGAGTITGLGTVNITDLTGAEASIDLSGITAINGTITISHTAQDSAAPGVDTLGGTDVALTAAANLAGFSVTLDDLDSDAAVDNELAGQTIRFATAAQAERTILVTGADADNGTAWAVNSEYYERDTNVVWNFDTITGTATAGVIDTSNYAAALGRVWVNDVLVDGQNIESIFSSPSAIEANPTQGVINLNSTTIIRIVDTAALDVLFPENLSVNRTVEIESFTQLPAGLVFNNPDKLVDVQNLTIDMGGAVTVGNIAIDDIVAASISNTNEFGSLSINSLIADTASHYLLPESWDPLVNPLPTDLAILADQANTLGDISSGPTRGELSKVFINTYADTDLLTTDMEGTALVVGTITFNEDATLAENTLAGDVTDNTAVLDITGDNNITIAAVDTTDADIVALTIDATGFTAVLDPVMHMDNTEDMTITNDNVAAGEIILSEVEGNELSSINAANFDGTLEITLSQIDSSDDDLNLDGDLLDAGENIAFTYTAGQGIETVRVASVGTNVPTLNALSTWSFTFTNAGAGSTLTLSNTAVLAATSNLVLVDVPLVIEGPVNLTQVNLTITGGSISVPTGTSLTLTVAQVLALDTANVDIIGSGTVYVTGNADDVDGSLLGAPLKTVNVDFSGITLTAADGADNTNTISNDDVFEVTLGGALNDTPAVAGQTITGSSNVDAIVTTSGENDVLNGAAGNDTLTGAGGVDTYNVTSGSDTIVGLAGDGSLATSTADIILTAAGATANATVTAGFVASAATVNNGATVLTANAAGDTTIDVSLATGTNGFTLTGGSTTDNNETLIGSSKADIINSGNATQDATGADTLTGNGGADQFVFEVTQSTPIAMVVATTTAGDDLERWDFDPQATGTATAFTLDVGNSTQTLTVQYRNGATVTSFVINDDATIDFTNGDALAARIATELSSRGLASSYDAATNMLTVNGTDGQSVELLSLTPSLGAAWTDPTPGNDVPVELLGFDGINDVVQVSTVTVGTGGVATAIAGEIYAITVNLAEGTAISYQFTATGGETEQDISDALVAGLNVAAGGNFVAANGGTRTITITDSAADNGGFTISYTSAGGISGSGASDLGAVDYTTADVITDFATGVDTISFGLAAGVLGTNYVEVAAAADYATALAAANTAFNGTVQYYMTSATDLDGVATTGLVNGQEGAGLLFFDANLDGDVDGVVLLSGITSATFAAGDIIA